MPQNPYQDALTALQQMSQGQVIGTVPSFQTPDLPPGVGLGSAAYKQAIQPLPPTDRQKAIQSGFVGTDGMTPEQQAAGAGRAQELQKLLMAPNGVGVQQMIQQGRAAEAQQLLDAAKGDQFSPGTQFSLPGGGGIRTATPQQLDPSGAISKAVEADTQTYQNLQQHPGMTDYLKNMLSGVAPSSMRGSLDINQRLQNLYNNIQNQSKAIGRKPTVAPPLGASARPMSPVSGNPSGYGASASSAQTTRMRAPSGETGTVNAADVQDLVKLGYQIVGQ
jgi:hypothetical protein